MSIGGVFKDAAASAAAATTVMSGTSKAVDAAGKSATVAGRGMAVASRSFGVMGVAARGLMGVLGGPVGLAVTLASLAGGALWSWMSAREAEDAAQAQTRMENIRDVIGEIRTAAVEANGDVKAFIKNLGDIKGLTGAKLQSTRQDFLQARLDNRNNVNRLINDAIGAGKFSAEENQVLLNVGFGIQRGGDVNVARMKADLDAIAKNNPALVDTVVRLQDMIDTMSELEGQKRTFEDAVDAVNGQVEKTPELLKKQTNENRNLAEASALAAESQKKFEKALEEANETAGDVTGMEDFNRAMKKIDETRKDLEKSLKEWMDNEKAAGKAIPAEEIERRTRQIDSSINRMRGNAVRNFREIQLAAQGLTLELDEISQKMLEDFRVSDAAASGGSVAVGVGRKYGEDKRSIALGIKETADALGISAEDLATAISYETAGTFDPKKSGPVTPWGQHRGLIQFGEPQARQHGVDWNNAVNSQLGPNGAVASYLRAAGVKPGMGLLEVYSAINAGGIGEKYFNRKDAHNGGAPGTVRDKVQNQMGGHRANARSLLGDYADASPGVIGENAGGRELALNLFQNVSSELSEQAQKVVGYAAIANPSLATNQEFVIAFQDGDAEKIAEVLRGGGDADRADEVLRVSAANDMIRSVEANIEASKTFTKAVEGLSFSGDDLKAGNRAEAVNREVAAIIKDMSQDGGSPSAALGVSSAEEAEKIVRARVERQLMLDVEKQRLELMNDMSESDDKSLRNDQQRIQVQDVMNAQGERAAELARIMNELRNEEQDTGVSRSDADRNEVASLRIKAWDAENAERLAKEAKDKAEEERDKAEKAHTDRIAIFQARIENLNAQLEAAVSSKDVSEQGRLKDEIRSVSDELLLATEAAKAFYGTLSGPEGELGILTMDRLGMSVKKSKSDLDQLSPEIMEISGVIENSLNGAVSSFSANVAQGMKPWQALKQAVGQAIGEMLVNIGKMITQAVIANSVMSALGLPTQGASPAANAATMSGGGFLTKAVGWLGGLVGGKFHEGGIIGDPSKNVDFLGSLLNLKPGERPIIAMDGEEMLTRRDPRHRENMGASLANMVRFHTGGVIGSSPDAAAASAAAAKASPMSGIMSMLSQAPKASETVVNVHNGFDDDDLRDRVLATPQGERAVLNILSRNPQKLKALMS